MTKRTKRAPRGKLKKMRVYCSAYRPFICGGNVHSPVCCDFYVEGPYDLGKNIEGYLLDSPSGGKLVVEGSTGGIVGASLAKVRIDVREAKPKVLREQLKAEVKRALTATPVSRENFWKGWLH